MISEIGHPHDSGSAYIGTHVRFGEGEMGERLSTADGIDAARRVVDTIEALALLKETLNEPPNPSSKLHEISFDNVPLIVNNDLVGDRTIGFRVTREKTKAIFVIREQFSDPEDSSFHHAVTFGYVARHIGKRAFVMRLGRPVHRVTVTENGEEYELMHTMDREKNVPSPTGLGIATGENISDVELDSVTQFVKSDVQVKLLRREAQRRRAKIAEEA